MAARYSDNEIQKFISERKVLEPNYKSKIQLRPKRGHQEQELRIEGDDNHEFSLILRQSNSNPLDFSVILAYCPEDSNQYFRLRRYNGKSHEHTNKIESNKFYNFHIHMAT